MMRFASLQDLQLGLSFQFFTKMLITICLLVLRVGDIGCVLECQPLLLQMNSIKR